MTLSIHSPADTKKIQSHYITFLIRCTDISKKLHINID